MNSQVTTTSQEVQSLGLTELELLEATFNEELRCQSEHRGYLQGKCTLEVVAIRIDCKDKRMVCSSVVDFYHEGFAGCGICGDYVDNCWKIIPI